MNGPQDLGGQMGFGPVAPEKDEPIFHAEWERRALGLTIAAGAFDSHLRGNAQLAAELGISGTPGWVVGDRALNGAVGREAIGDAIEEARQS